jgi:hypothetical protein
MVRLLPAPAKESRGSDPEDTLRETTRHFGRTDLTMKAAIYTGYCLFEAGDRGNTKPGPIMATSVAPTSKKTLGSARSRANLKFQKTSLNTAIPV